MPKYRKKPVIVEAVRIQPNFAYDTRHPDWILSAFKKGTILILHAEYAIIETLEGDMRADIGDWIIKGVEGELYPCKNSIFKQTYEKVDSGD